jgi:hypothetical protein
MTLEEAIEHAKEQINETECGQEHAQLAIWLQELLDYHKLFGIKE